MSVKISAAVGAALFATSALAALPARADAQDRPKPAHQHVLAAFSTRRLMILPTHYLRMGDSLGWADQITDQTAFLSSLDDELAFAFSDRGVKKVWVFPAAIDAIAKRNEPYAPDPHAMAAQWLRYPGPKRLPKQVPDPIASQLRTLVAMQDGGQLVLLPVELRFEPVPGGMECAVLRFVIFDAVRAKIIYMADVQSDPQTSFGPALAASLAGHLADQLGPPIQ
ncbi:MAG: hypothetical protein JWO39_1999 [Gemmatimonadetes bacterium]|nr:hypothetical protein [Gemmatimonadota bacterium]